MSTASYDWTRPGQVTDERYSASAVIDRMKEAFSVESDAALAEALRTTRQNVSKWKSRNAIPYAEAVFTSILRGVSLDYLLAGNSEAERSTSGVRVLDPEIVKAILLTIHAMGFFDIPANRDFQDAMETISKAIVHQYARSETLIDELVSKKGLSPEVARSATILATELLGSDGTIFGRRATEEGKPIK
jgi:hypothetical protein